MPRPLPRLADDFERELNQATGLTTQIETARVVLLGFRDARAEISLTAIELTYELAYLRTFMAWEYFLEGTFYRLLCGYTRLGSQERPKGGAAFSPTIAAAAATVMAGRDYVLWHDVAKVIRRADTHLDPGNFRLVLASASGRLNHFAAVRHRIAHIQEHGQREFDKTTTALTGRRYRASRPGRFLRDWVPAAVPPKRWLHAISEELLGLAHQLC